jgi:hypothetical protein
VDPTEQWIAYGIVADTDRDGVPDWRSGLTTCPSTRRVSGRTGGGVPSFTPVERRSRPATSHGSPADADCAPDVGWLEPSPQASRADAGEVAPPIDSLEEAIAAVGEADSSFLDFQPLDPNNIGASAWVGGVRQPRLRQIHVRRDRLVRRFRVIRVGSPGTDRSGDPKRKPPRNEQLISVPVCIGPPRL